MLVLSAASASPENGHLQALVAAERQCTRDAIDADLDEMEATLAYLRDASKSEPKKVTDPAALLSTLVD